MKRLKLEDIKNLPNVPTKEITIDEWNCTMLVQGISKAMQIELGRQLDNKETDAFDYQKELLKVCVVEPELDDEAIAELYKKDSTVIDKIFLIINEVNGIGGSASAEEFPQE